MKKLLAVFLLCLPLARAAGTVTSSVQAINQGTTAYVVTVNWTGDASTGTVPTTTITGLGPVQGYQITQIQTVPGTPAPTAGYSITVKDQNGYDMAGGQAVTLSATAAASFATTSAVPPVVGSLSFALTGNSVASAQGKVLLYIFKPSVLAAANLLGRYGTGSSSGITDLTGDVTATGPGSAPATLATVNANTGTCGDSTHVCQVTLNAKGLATAASPVSISGGGTVTVVGGGSLTSTALVTGGGTTTLQTPAATATMDSSGNISTPGSVSSGVGSGVAGTIELTQGTAPTPAANSIDIHAPTSVSTAYTIKLPAASATGLLRRDNSSNVDTESLAELSGDVSTSGSNAVTVAKVNGVSYGASPSTYGVPVITASNTATYKVIPDCQDTGGNHLNFTQSTATISCGTSGGGSSSYFPQYSCIDNTTGWSDYNYGTQMTITALPNTAGSNCGIWGQQEGSDYIRARVKSTGSSTFNAKYALRIGTMIGDGAEAGVLVKDSGTQSVVCGLRFAAGSQRFIWKGDRYTTTSATSAAETINSDWTAGGAQYGLAYNTGSGTPGAYFTGQGLLYIELASTNGTTTTCRASFDGVIWIPVWSSTFLTPAATGYYTRSGFSTTDNLYVLGVN